MKESSFSSESIEKALKKVVAIKEQKFSKNLPYYLQVQIKRVDSIYKDYDPKNDMVLDGSIYVIEKFYYGVFKQIEMVEDYWESREVNLLVRCLDYKTESFNGIIFSEYFSTAISIIEKYWRKNMLQKIIYALLRNWLKLISDHQKNYRLLVEFIGTKLDFYTGNNKLLEFMITNRELFLNADGSINFVSKYLLGSKDPIADILASGIPSQYLFLEYFNEVFYAYFTINNKNIILEFGIIERIVKTRVNKDAKRVVIAKIINSVSETVDYKDKLLSLAVQEIGDPGISSDWLIEDRLLLKYSNEVETAKQILNLWINNEIVELFFSQLAFYPERKDFWKRYIKLIPNIKLSGKRDVLESLSVNKKISSFIKSRFIIANGGNPVLLFVVNNYLLVEYSEQGNAFYAYNKNSEEYKMFEQKSINNTIDFKRTSLPLLTADSSEGRLIHNSGVWETWQDKLGKWLQYKVGIVE